MQIEMMPLAQLLRMKHHRNPKLHNHVELASSFRRFGFTAPPTIDEVTQVLVAGHGRLETLEMMREAGQPPPERIELVDDEWMVPVIRGISFKSDRERDAYLVADNQIPIGAGWNRDALSDLLSDLADDDEDGEALTGLGFEQDELADLLADADDDDAGGSDGSEGDGGRDVNVEGHTRTIGGHKVRPPAQMTQADWKIHLGDCVEGMKAKIPDASIDAVVTDPPAGISFMGKSWDGDKGGRDQWIEWLRTVMAEAYRALKPGGHLLAWALPRTSHWTMLAIEQAGFEIRDVVYHAFGTGFPKNLDVSKAIDAKLGAEREVVGTQPVPGEQMKEMSLGGQTGENMANGHGWTGIKYGGPATEQAAEWDGWGTALKPAVEPWILARKPLDGSVAENVMKYRTGAINIDACRVGDELMEKQESTGEQLPTDQESWGAQFNTGRRVVGEKVGRWPAHLVLTHGAGCRPVGVVEDSHSVHVGEKLGPGVRGLEFGHGTMATEKVTTHVLKYECVLDCPVRLIDEQSGAEGDELGASRFFYVAKPSRAETEAGLGELPEKTGGELTERKDGSKGLENPRAGAGRGGGRRNVHPTKKPIELMRYLVRMVTPPGGLVLDPFTGSGTTGLASLVEGCRFVGFEMSAEYHAIASERMRTIIDDPRSVEDADSDDEPPTERPPQGSTPEDPA